MRIAILTTGRFHLCDLARELENLGHDVAFYSLVPPWRTRQFGLSAKANRWLAPLVPLFAATHANIDPRWAKLSERLLLESLDRFAPRVVGKCDVFIGLSGASARTAEWVRKKYRAKVFIERGSRHIRSQKRILDAMPNAELRRTLVPGWNLQRELDDYDVADTIVVPAKHVVDSFVEEGVPRTKLFRNPYGVDLNMFPPTPSPPVNAPRRVLMVGTWSYQKGCDILDEACRGIQGAELLHVGAVGDAPLPSRLGFRHFDAVDQRELTRFYAMAHVFGLASRQDGLSLVQAQALASGLRLVCTNRTGGEDLQDYIAESSAIEVVPPDDANAFRTALVKELELTKSQGFRDWLGSGRENLSWSAYGRRYDARLRQQV